MGELDPLISKLRSLITDIENLRFSLILLALDSLHFFFSLPENILCNFKKTI